MVTVLQNNSVVAKWETKRDKKEKRFYASKKKKVNCKLKDSLNFSLIILEVALVL